MVVGAWDKTIQGSPCIWLAEDGAINGKHSKDSHQGVLHN